MSTQKDGPAKATVEDDESTEFVEITASPAKRLILTEHQREAKSEQRTRRHEQPATYTHLDEAAQAPGGGALIPLPQIPIFVRVLLSPCSCLSHCSESDV